MYGIKHGEEIDTNILGKCVQMDQCVQDRKQNCRHSVFGKFPEKGTVKAWKQWWYKEEGG